MPSPPRRKSIVRFAALGLLLAAIGAGGFALKGCVRETPPPVPEAAPKFGPPQAGTSAVL